MSTQPLVSSRYRAFDSNGNPLAGGLLYTYAAGTTTPLATYTTRAGSVANANPVVLDSDGEADVWMTAGVDYKFVLKDSSGATQSTVDNFPSPSAQSASTDAAATPPGGRLTLTAGAPVTTNDVTGATILYYVPATSDKVPLYDGTNWTLYSVGSGGISQATTDITKSPLAVVANSNYDVFAWNDSGTVRLSRGPAWASDTARGSGVGTSELQQVNGRYVNKNAITNGPAASCGLYVGSVRSDGSAQLNDSMTKRHVWNLYNGVWRPMFKTNTNGPSFYAGASFQQYDADATNQLDIILGLDAYVRVETRAHIGAAAAATAVTAVGLDSTTDPSTLSSQVAQPAGTPGSASQVFAGGSRAETVVALGRHRLVWLQRLATGASPTWGGTYTGSLSTDLAKPAIQGAVFA